MTTEILINVTPHETRVAVLENGALQDVFIERTRKRGLVGNIYKGRVCRVLPGMQAAFVDIGLDKAAFLYVGDIITEDGKDFFEDEEPEQKEDNAEESRPSREIKTPIQDLIKEGQHLMVQVAKDPLGTKGARITTHISLPGRGVVYMPYVKHTGISRKIESEEEKERLKNQLNKLQTEDAQLQKQLSNQNFVDKAPPEKVAEIRNRVAEIDLRVKTLTQNLDALK